MTEPVDHNPALQTEVERNYPFNFAVNVLQGSVSWLGFSFLNPTIILPLYISHFTSNALIIGLIPFLNTAGFLLPQLFTANFVERAPLKKWFPVNLGFFTQPLPVLLLIPGAYFLAASRPCAAVAAFLILYAWFTFGVGLVVVGWQDMISKIIPFNRRGRFFGITTFFGNASSILGALAVAIVLEKFTFPSGFVFSFAAAAGLILLSWCILILVREPAIPSSKPAVSQLEYLRSLPKVVQDEPNFRKYILAQIIFSLSGMASGFLMVYSARTWNLPDSQAGGFILALQAGQSLSNLFFGFLADRKGHKLNLEISFLLSIASLALAVFATGPLWFFPIFFLRGAVLACTEISGASIAMEFSGPQNRATFIGLANTVPGLTGSLAPLLGGWLAGSFGYPKMFVLSLLIAVASYVILRFAVQDPRRTPVSQA
jgi:MFS family permease